MVLMVVMASLLFGGLYFYFTARAEEQRQEFRRQSRLWVRKAASKA